MTASPCVTAIARLEIRRSSRMRPKVSSAQRSIDAASSFVRAGPCTVADRFHTRASATTAVPKPRKVLEERCMRSSKSEVLRFIMILDRAGDNALSFADSNEDKIRVLDDSDSGCVPLSFGADLDRAGLLRVNAVVECA